MVAEPFWIEIGDISVVRCVNPNSSWFPLSYTCKITKAINKWRIISSRFLPSVQYQALYPSDLPCLMRQFCSSRLFIATSQPPYSSHSPLASSQLWVTSEKRYLCPVYTSMKTWLKCNKPQNIESYTNLTFQILPFWQLLVRTMSLTAQKAEDKWCCFDKNWHSLQHNLIF